MKTRRDDEIRDLLSAYLDGELSGEELHSAERLLAEDSGARSALAALRTLSESLTNERVPELPAGLAERISDALDHAAVPLPVRKRPWHRRWQLPLAAAATFVAAITLGVLYHDRLVGLDASVVPPLAKEAPAVSRAAPRSAAPAKGDHALELGEEATDGAALETRPAPPPVARAIVAEKKQRSAPESKILESLGGARLPGRKQERKERARPQMAETTSDDLLADEAPRFDATRSRGPEGGGYSAPAPVVTSELTPLTLTWSPGPIAAESAPRLKESKEPDLERSLLSVPGDRRRQEQKLTRAERRFLDLLEAHGASALRVDGPKRLWKVTVPDKQRGELLDALRAHGILGGPQEIASPLLIEVLNETPQD